MRVEKQEFAWELSQLYAPVKQEQELHESWWEFTGYYCVIKSDNPFIHSKRGGGQSWPMDVIYYRLYYECPRSEGDVPIPGLTPFCAIKFEPVQSQW